MLIFPLFSFTQIIFFTEVCNLYMFHLKLMQTSHLNFLAFHLDKCKTPPTTGSRMPAWYFCQLHVKAEWEHAELKPRWVGFSLSFRPRLGAFDLFCRNIVPVRSFSKPQQIQFTPFSICFTFTLLKPLNTTTTAFSFNINGEVVYLSTAVCDGVNDNTKSVQQSILFWMCTKNEFTIKSYMISQFNNIQ